jgi:hypothetical protein
MITGALSIVLMVGYCVYTVATYRTILEAKRNAPRRYKEKCGGIQTQRNK